VKKILLISATFAVAFVAFTFLPKTQAQKTLSGKGSPDNIERVKQTSLDFLRNTTALRSLGNADELKVQTVEIDNLKMAHTKVRQSVNDIPVWGGEAIVHLNADGSLFTITDDLKESIFVNTQPNFSAEVAIEIAQKFYKGSPFLTEEPKADLWIYRGKDRDHLAYRVQMRREDNSQDTAMPVIFVDAQTGEKIFKYDNLQTASGTSLYSGTVTIGTSKVGSTYYMEDLTKKIGTFDNRNTTSSTYRFTDTNDVWNSTSQKAGVDAHYGATKTYDYYKNTFGRNGIDGSGGPGYYSAAANSSIGLISSKVHYSSNYNNAFWNGSYMTYGDGDGSTFSPLVTLDIAGHEMTHGVTERTAGLVYSYESGALNEAVSDIFGAMVERYAKGESSNTWKIGEQAYTPATSGDALRYMDNTHLGGDPDHYSERYTGSADNGGVHTNSGIANYQFYLLAKGGTHHLGGSMTGIGADKAAAIWYRALTSYMTSSTNFKGARTATLNAATALYGSGSTEYSRVAQSWSLVGVN
jgi:thermolysin